MNAVERDDVSHALCTTMGFFGKKLDGPSERIWFSAFRGFSPDAIKRALAEYTRKGRYAPKPIDILDILARQREAKEATEDKKPYTPCPEDIHQAWLWFTKKITADSGLLKGIFSKTPEVDEETAERFILVVNQQAKLFNRPDAIPDEFKLKEVWG